jgi:hypothetical protein
MQPAGPHRCQGLLVLLSCFFAIGAAALGVSAWRSIETRVASASKHAGRSGALYTVRDGHLVVEHPEATLDAWSHRHRHASTVAVRYDPAHESTATFVGADPALDDDPVTGTLAGILVFGLIAIGARVGASRLAGSTPGMSDAAPQ